VIALVAAVVSLGQPSQLAAAPKHDKSPTSQKPVVHLSANNTTVGYDESAELSWTALNATVCTASGDWDGTMPTSGTKTVGPLTTRGTFVLSCSGQHPRKATESVTIDVVIENDPPTVNTAPQVNAGANRSVTLPNTLMLPGTVSDDGLPNPPAAVTTTWSQVSGPGTVSFTDASSVSSTVSFDVDGTYTLRLAADDGALVSSDEMQVTVQPAPNSAPQLAPIGDQSLAEGDSLALLLSASDVDEGDVLSFSHDHLASFVTLTDNGNRTATLALTPGFADNGTYSVTIRVTDDGSPILADEETLTVSVTDQNRAPQIDPIADVTIVENDTQTVALSASDPDSGDGVSFSEVGLPSFASLTDFNNGTGQIALMPGSTDVGQYTAIVTVTDHGSSPLTGQSALDITVTSAFHGSALLTWTAPNTNTDGSPLTDLAGFRIYYGSTSGGPYPNMVPINNASVNSHQIDNLSAGAYYFVITALNTSGEESAYSDPPASGTIP